LTDPAVPTGMNAGVGTSRTPAVPGAAPATIRPALAALLVS